MKLLANPNAFWRCAFSSFAAALGLLAALVVSGCDRTPDASAPQFTILAGSELKELEPALKDAAAQAGLALQISYAGTLDMVERINAGEKFDAILPPNGAYPALALEAKPVAREKLFYSRVALGVKSNVAEALGWQRQPPGWNGIAQAAGAGKFRYAMSNPASSNTGMSALFAVASAVAGKTEDLSASEVNAQVLKDFLQGQKLTAGSSGWLAEAYARDPGAVDGLVNYEAVILRLNETLAPADRLTLIYPRDGVISADYPLLLLDAAKRADYDKLVLAIKSAAFQSQALHKAYLRPAVAEAAPNPALPAVTVAELSFPNRLEVIDAVLTAYQSELRRPATAIFVLDVSGSMRGERLAQLQQALKVLSGAQPSSASQRYAAFQRRERVVIISFRETVATPRIIQFDDAHLAENRQAIVHYADGLAASGGTAIYDALTLAGQLGHEEYARDKNRQVSIVLMTDGESNAGMKFAAFKEQLQAWDDHWGAENRLRVFPVIFGEADPAQMRELAQLTGGRAFDARQTPLTQVFKEIRGYQ